MPLGASSIDDEVVAAVVAAPEVVEAAPLPVGDAVVGGGPVDVAVVVTDAPVETDDDV